MTTIRLILVSEPNFVVATATMDESGEISYTGVDEPLRAEVDRALAGKDDRIGAFNRLAEDGWSNAYLMIELPEQSVVVGM